MNINRDEALRAQSLAESLMQKSDFTSARKLAIKAHSMDSTLENISHMTMVCDVHCAAAKEKMLGNNEMDWYGILQVDVNANDVIIKKQYRKLALLLHPDKNKLPGAEAAFKLIGEAQRTLLDKGKRMVYDMKRKSSVRPALPPYRSQRVPCDDPPPTWQTSEYMRSIYEGVRPENMMHRPRPPRKGTGFGQRSTFWTSCFFCGSRYEYGREYIKRGVSCQSCKKLFVAFEVPFVPPQGSCSYNHQNTSSFPQQSQRACPPEPHRRTDDPATAFTGKAAASSTPENNKGKRKRKSNMDESSVSSDSESSSESEDDVTMAAGEDMGSKGGGKEPRRSVRSKRQVSYNESFSDDDDGDLANDVGENVDTGKEEEKQTHEDHHHHQATETLNPKEKIEEDSLDDSSLGGEANVISCDDPEFSDFDKLREKSCFDQGQVWALYDEGEGMPRFYAVIREVTTIPNFSVKYVWLEAGEDETRDLPVSVGSFVRGDEEAKANGSDLFSHLVQSKTRRNAKNFTVFPGRGETWALFKNWDMDSSSDSPREYEFVEILSDYVEGGMISVGFLFKVEGFKYVYSPMPEEEADTFEIQRHEFFRFSHRVPSFRLKGTEGRGVLEGWYELDPAALPGPGSQEATAQDQDQEHQSPHSGSAC